jgi:RNA polymerase sigma-70 factor (ECF subfamily)
VGAADELSGRIQVLLDRLQNGDESVRDELIWYSCERLKSLARKMMKPFSRLYRWEETDDVFQDAMLRLHRSLEGIKPESVAQFFALAATQIRRTLLDMARRYFGPEGPGMYLHCDAATASDEPASPGQWTEFYEVLATLPEDERMVVDLLWFDGLTQAEAAIALGVNERTIRRRWYSARYLLYKVLRHEP